ncbi:MAG: HD domain-containing protein [Fibromonadaceae bacterium]|jgi:putative two-component system response regulator|nr:HD domain-containing protein [Fibromonadaceae bacterium]
MEKILLISKEPERWRDFEKLLSGSYEFIFSKPKEAADFKAASIIATDEVSNIEKIPSTEKSRLPLVFFDEADDFSKEIQARRQGATEYVSLPTDRELLLFRFKNLSQTSQLIKANGDDIRWMRMIRREMLSMQEGMAEIMAQTVESRDENTGGHVTRTATFIGILGDEFVESGKLTRDELNLITMAAPLHDIGKIAVRDSILLKPGPLTDSERLEMMSHPAKGATLIQKMQRRFESHSYLKYAYDIALNHHERFDGKGYPNGKKGEEIPFWARLMAVIDVYDALVSDRIYRKGMSKEKAYEIIFSGVDTQFDPEVLEAFDNCKDYLL